jgi:hypothetical protein
MDRKEEQAGLIPQAHVSVSGRMDALTVSLSLSLIEACFFIQ